MQFPDFIVLDHPLRYQCCKVVVHWAQAADQLVFVRCWERKPVATAFTTEVGQPAGNYTGAVISTLSALPRSTLNGYFPQRPF